VGGLDDLRRQAQDWIVFLIWSIGVRSIVLGRFGESYPASESIRSGPAPGRVITA
jgi:hypothetical protein